MTNKKFGQVEEGSTFQTFKRSKQLEAEKQVDRFSFVRSDPKIGRNRGDFHRADWDWEGASPCGKPETGDVIH